MSSRTILFLIDDVSLVYVISGECGAAYNNYTDDDADAVVDVEESLSEFDSTSSTTLIVVQPYVPMPDNVADFTAPELKEMVQPLQLHFGAEEEEFPELGNIVTSHDLPLSGP